MLVDYLLAGFLIGYFHTALES
eukprot:SAG11_NODE_36735_length_260_cov_0.639752_1_plen_21_part_10